MAGSGALIVAKKRTTTSRHNTLVRFDDSLVEKAKKVAALRGISVAEYLSTTMAPIIDRDLAKEIKKLTGGD